MTRLLMIFFSLLLAGCASVDLSDYGGNRPVFDLASYFSGTVDGWGMVQNRGGKVTQRFSVRIEGRLEGTRLTLEEFFEYDDGRKEQKTWRLVKDGNRYTGRREDTVGEGEGRQEGNAFNIRYVLRVPVEGRHRAGAHRRQRRVPDDRRAGDRAVRGRGGRRDGGRVAPVG